MGGTHSAIIHDNELLHAELVRLLQVGDCACWMSPSDPALHAALAADDDFQNQRRRSSKSLHHAISKVTLAIDCHRQVSGGRYSQRDHERGQYVPLLKVHEAATVISAAWRKRCQAHRAATVISAAWRKRCQRHRAATIISNAWRRRCLEHRRMIVLSEALMDAIESMLKQTMGTEDMEEQDIEAAEAGAPALPSSLPPEDDLILTEKLSSPTAAPVQQQSPALKDKLTASPVRSRTASMLQMLPLQPSALLSGNHQVHTVQEEEEEEEKELDASAALASLLENQAPAAEQGTPPPAVPGFNRARKERRTAKTRAKGAKRNAGPKNAYGPGGLVSAARAPRTLRD